MYHILFYFIRFFVPEQRSDNDETAGDTKLKLYTVRSRIKITAKSNDDRAKYKCEAQHRALTDSLSTSVQIRVLCEFP